MQRRGKLAIGGILGAVVGLLAWCAISYGILAAVSHYYPNGGGLGLPSDETIKAFDLCVIASPFVGLAGAWAGYRLANRRGERD